MHELLGEFKDVTIS